MVFAWCCWVVCFFKQKTAYEMRISDWSSDVCSSDLVVVEHLGFHLARGQASAQLDDAVGQGRLAVVDMGDDREIADVPHRVGQGRASVVADGAALRGRAAERRVGEEGVSTCRYRWSPFN